MNKGTDPLYLLMDQYCDASNLNARTELYRRFNVNKQNWHQWVFDQFQFPRSAKILELGCGPGWLWRENLEKISTDWEITLSDFSSGMVDEAEQHLKGKGPFQFDVIDIQAISMLDEHFDGVIANHMLYHVSNRPKAFEEIARILKPGGLFYTSTNGYEHLRQLSDLMIRLQPDMTDPRQFTKPFRLENGGNQLAPYFQDIKIHRHKNALEVTEFAPLMAYLLSDINRDELTEERLVQLQTYIQTQIDENGSFHISTESGLFEARKPGGSA